MATPAGLNGTDRRINSLVTQTEVNTNLSPLLLTDLKTIAMKLAQANARQIDPTRVQPAFIDQSEEKAEPNPQGGHAQAGNNRGNEPVVLESKDPKGNAESDAHGASASGANKDREQIKNREQIADSVSIDPKSGQEDKTQQNESWGVWLWKGAQSTASTALKYLQDTKKSYNEAAARRKIAETERREAYLNSFSMGNLTQTLNTDFLTATKTPETFTAANYKNQVDKLIQAFQNTRSINEFHDSCTTFIASFGLLSETITSELAKLTGQRFCCLSLYPCAKKESLVLFNQWVSFLKSVDGRLKNLIETTKKQAQFQTHHYDSKTCISTDLKDGTRYWLTQKTNLTAQQRQQCKNLNDSYNNLTSNLNKFRDRIPKRKIDKAAEYSQCLQKSVKKLHQQAIDICVAVPDPTSKEYRDYYKRNCLRFYQNTDMCLRRFKDKTVNLRKRVLGC